MSNEAKLFEMPSETPEDKPSHGSQDELSLAAEAGMDELDYTLATRHEIEGFGSSFAPVKNALEKPDPQDAEEVEQARALQELKMRAQADLERLQAGEAANYLGEEPNTYTEEEGKEIGRLTTQGVHFSTAYYRATGRKYVTPTNRRERPHSGYAYTGRPHPKGLGPRIRTIGDANSGDPHLR
jgi:hypothetical protein